MKKDINNIKDIEHLVNTFYNKVQQDEVLAPIFESRILGYWDSHLDKMYRFWNAALFNVREYTGNPFMKHIGLPLSEEHFERWIKLFYETVDEYFEGRIADEAKRRAMIMANTFYDRMNIQNTNYRNPKV